MTTTLNLNPKSCTVCYFLQSLHKFISQHVRIFHKIWVQFN